MGGGGGVDYLVTERYEERMKEGFSYPEDLAVRVEHDVVLHGARLNDRRA